MGRGPKMSRQNGAKMKSIPFHCPCNGEMKQMPVGKAKRPMGMRIKRGK